MATMTRTENLKRGDYCLLALFCLVLFGEAMFSGRGLSIHESVLPQSAREMYADGDWVIPKRGGAPWLESPPLPQWVTVAIASLFGRCDSIAVVRLGPTLVATAVVLMVAWMGTRFFGRGIGLLSGFVMATTCQFLRYAWLAEDEIYLCGLVTLAVTLFVRLEFSDAPEQAEIRESDGFFGARRPAVLAFFIALGMTNLAKGLIFGTAMAVIPAGAYLIWNADLSRIKRYLWLWGWLAFAVVMLAWPVAAYLRFPDVLDVWWFDLGGRLDGSYQASAEPWWYYPVNLLWMLAPWTLVIPVGMWATRDAALRTRYSPERFLWCWALLVPAVYSLAKGKHHHYMLHAIAPWSILASVGLIKVRETMLAWPKSMHNPFWSLGTTAAPIMIVIWLLRERVPGGSGVYWPVLVACPFLIVLLSWAIMHFSARRAASTLFLTLAVAYTFGHFVASRYVDTHRVDTQFLTAVRQQVPTEEKILVDLNVEALRGFMLLFYLDDNSIPLHNLSFARDKRIDDPAVFVLTRTSKRPEQDELSTTDVVMQSPHTGREVTAADRLTLFRLTYGAGARSVSGAGVRISPMQAMYRAEGPVLR